MISVVRYMRCTEMKTIYMQQFRVDVVLTGSRSAVYVSIYR
jgi:hypothetical protein